MSENKEMKSLNGYEVVDAKAREDIEELKSGGSSSGGGLQPYYIKAQVYSALTDEDKELFVRIYDCLASENKMPPDDIVVYANHLNFYYIVDCVSMPSSNITTCYLKLHLSGPTDGDVYYEIGILKSDKSVASFSKRVNYPSNGLTIDKYDVGCSIYGDSNTSSTSMNFSLVPDKALLVVLDVQDNSGGGVSSMTMGRTDGWNWYGSVNLTDGGGTLYTLQIQLGQDGTVWYSFYDGNGGYFNAQINAITVISNP